MNSDQLAGKWTQVKGQLKNAWSDLTDTDLNKVGNTIEEGVGYLQEKYGETKENIQEKMGKLLDKTEEKTDKWT